MRCDAAHERFGGTHTKDAVQPRVRGAVGAVDRRDGRGAPAPAQLHTAVGGQERRGPACRQGHLPARRAEGMYGWRRTQPGARASTCTAN
jgi:hypothetical protein